MFWATAEWRIKPGQEEAFEAAWVDLVISSKGTFPGRRAFLLRDRERPGVYVSMGAWPTADMMGTWRDVPGLVQRFETLRGFAASYDLRSFDEVIDVS